MLKVQIINKGHQPLPAFATPQSVGMDLRANIIRLSCFILWSVDSFLRDFFGTETWANFLSNGYFEKSWIGPISKYPIQNISIFNMCRLRTAQILGLMRMMVK